eukprot:SAG31_NODE_1852_length_7072_cov_12.649792_4_plen_521_part_00
MAAARPVFVRVDLRPMAGPVEFTLSWTADPGSQPVAIPASALAPTVSTAQRRRRDLQESTATGWNHCRIYTLFYIFIIYIVHCTGWSHWQRHSQIAVQSLPHQFGISLSVQNASGARYAGALPEPRSRQVKMGPHAFDGSYSQLSFIPFASVDDPCLKGGADECSGANVTVETAHVPSNVSSASRQSTWTDCVLVVRCAGGGAGGGCASFSLNIDAAGFWGAAINFSTTTSSGFSFARPTIKMTSGDLGSATVVVQGSSHVDLDGTSLHATFPAQDSAPLVITLSMTETHIPLSTALAAVATQRQATLVALNAGGRRAGGLNDAYDAMATVISWNVNYDPRVSVTAPVSRTFESSFDFIFFDWDMYFLSLMAGTTPAAQAPGAFNVAISNLIEVTQTRSVYGHVMNKRAAAGATSSDTNDRTEPLVGSAVVLQIYEDAKGTDREEIMQWVVELLYPTLYGWNQWAWDRRRYNVGKDPPHGGLLTLGNDPYTIPCEGGTVSKPLRCGSKAGAILESGMDNR